MTMPTKRDGAEGRKPSLRRNMLANASMTALNFLIPLVTLPYSSRILGPEGIGRVGFALSIAGNFAMFAGLIGTIYGTREVARARDDEGRLGKVFSELLAINGLAYGLAFLAFLAVAVLTPRFHEDLPVFMVAAASLAAAAINVDWLFQGLEDYGFIFFRNLAAKLASVLLLFVLVHSNGDVFPYAIVAVSALVVGNVWNLAGAMRRVRFSLRGIEAGRHIKGIGSFYLVNLLTVVTVNLDKTWIGFFGGAAQLGLYSLADKVVFLGVSVTSSLSVVLLPRVSHAFAKGDEGALRQGLELSWKFALLLALPLAVGAGLLSGDIARALGGEAFGEAGSVLGILSVDIFSITLAYIFGVQILCGRGMERRYLISLALAVGVLAFGLWALVPRFGALGGAISVASSYLVQAITQAIQSWKVFKTVLRPRNDFKFLLACLAMAGAVLAFRGIPAVAALGPIPRFFASGALGGLVYFATLFGTREEFVRRLGGAALGLLRGRAGQAR
ncbi:MAG TPA: oligosaccharide flippase family protein [Rectinemataceae bacterium]|nr:oligosaccharide flippase family protein [Rectinemataceae bacterium]